MKRPSTLPLLILLLTSTAALAQEQPRSATPTTAEAKTTAETTQAPPSNLIEAQYIPKNSKVYIAPFKSEDADKPLEGFETYIAAALRKKNVPLLMVTDRTQADFEIVGTADKKGAGWAKKVFLGDWRSTTSASLSVVNLRTGVVAFADSSHRASANRGLRSSAEKLAKYLKKKMEEDEKKMR
jgi:hypothetical protein